MKQRKLKKRVRERMARTGESYMAARRHLLAGDPEPERTVKHYTFKDGKVDSVTEAKRDG